MSERLIEECDNFALYVANRDGDTWNALCRELTTLYRENDEKVFDFLGFDLCHRVVDGMFGDYFHRFCEDDLKCVFYKRSRAVIALTSQEILFQIKRELEIGNYYE